jgi:hypothetical protein
MYHTSMTPLQTHHTYVDPVATRLVTIKIITEIHIPHKIK